MFEIYYEKLISALNFPCERTRAQSKTTNFQIWNEDCFIRQSEVKGAKPLSLFTAVREVFLRYEKHKNEIPEGLDDEVTYLPPVRIVKAFYQVW